MATREQIEVQAEATLREHGLHRVPVDAVVVAQRLGVKVLDASFSQPHISGMIKSQDGATTIYARRSDAKVRKRFTIAHELGHYVLGHLASRASFEDDAVALYRMAARAGDRTSALEVEASAFAAALLMPATLLRERFALCPDVTLLSEWFVVSEQAMAIRLETLGLV